MPLYQYRCPNCHEPHEIRASVQMRDAQPCPDCNHLLTRARATPFVASIVGIPNRIGREIEGS